jgi:hypothetical protein
MVKRFGKYRRKLCKDMKNMEENSEMILKIWKKGKSNNEKICNFILYFPNLFTIRLAFLPYCPYHFSFQLTFLPYIPYHFTIQLTFLPYFPYLFTIQLSFLPYFPQALVVSQVLVARTYHPPFFLTFCLQIYFQ